MVIYRWFIIPTSTNNPIYHRIESNKEDFHKAVLELNLTYRHMSTSINVRVVDASGDGINLVEHLAHPAHPTGIEQWALA